MLSILRKFWSPKTCSEKLYAIAFGLSIFALIVGWPDMKSHWTDGLLIVAATLSGSAFIIWIAPIIIKLWESYIGQVARIIIHAVLISSTGALARFHVSNALQLPPQDFDLTVTILTAILYPFTLAMVMAMIGVIFYIVLICTAVIAMISTNPLLGRIISWILSLSPKPWADATSESGRMAFATRMFMHAFGAIIVGVALLFIGASGQTALSSHPEFLRLVAYYADYQSAPRYPGVEPDAQLHLHENGIVSYANRHGFNIEIRVSTINPPSRAPK